MIDYSITFFAAGQAGPGSARGFFLTGPRERPVAGPWATEREAEDELRKFPGSARERLALAACPRHGSACRAVGIGSNRCVTFRCGHACHADRLRGTR